MNATEWFILGFWVLAGLAIVLGIVISVDEWNTENGGENG